MSSYGSSAMFQDGWLAGGPANGSAPSLEVESSEVLVRLSVEPTSLEDLLDTLAGLDFPVNPNILHHATAVTIEFPSSLRDVNKIKDALAMFGPSAGPAEILRF